MFSVGAQLLLVLPVYFLGPFALFVLLVAGAAYSFATSSWALLALSAWWLVTTPYWSVIHFVAFPVLFAASLGLQLCLAVGLFATTIVYPSLPADAVRYYDSLMEERSSRKPTKLTKSTAHPQYIKDIKPGQARARRGLPQGGEQDADLSGRTQGGAGSVYGALLNRFRSSSVVLTVNSVGRTWSCVGIARVKGMRSPPPRGDRVAVGVCPMILIRVHWSSRPCPHLRG